MTPPEPDLQITQIDSNPPAGGNLPAEQKPAENPPVIVREDVTPEEVSPTPVSSTENSVITKDLDVSDEYQTVIMSDTSLSYSARLSFRVITSADDKLIVKGLALDQKEKERIGAMVQKMAGTKTLDNQMTTVNE
jgi:hypothetical protein